MGTTKFDRRHIGRDERVTPLEVAFLFYGKTPRIVPDDKAVAIYDRRREYVVMRYALGWTLHECANVDGITTNRARQIIGMGVRAIRLTGKRTVWRMLAIERPEIMHSKLARVCHVGFDLRERTAVLREHHGTNQRSD